MRSQKTRNKSSGQAQTSPIVRSLIPPKQQVGKEIILKAEKYIIILTQNITNSTYYLWESVSARHMGFSASSEMEFHPGGKVTVDLCFLCNPGSQFG